MSCTNAKTEGGSGKTTDGDGNVTNYAYDSLGRPRQRHATPPRPPKGPPPTTYDSSEPGGLGNQRRREPAATPGTIVVVQSKTTNIQLFRGSLLETTTLAGEHHQR